MVNFNTKANEQKKLEFLKDKYEPKWSREGKSSPPTANDVIGTGGISFKPMQQREISKWQLAKGYSMQMAIGGAMGMFVGSSVVFLHAVTTKNYTNLGKRMLQSGLPFSCIFAVGSIARG